MKRKTNIKEVIAIIFVLVIFGIFIFYSLEKEQVACTEDLKLCPGGTGVGRVAPNCNFAPCPISKVCEIDSDCLVFGQDGDCNCGCFNKNALPQEPVGDCFCAAPTSCECVEGICKGIFG
jgi:hypothetical protein